MVFHLYGNFPKTKDQEQTPDQCVQGAGRGGEGRVMVAEGLKETICCDETVLHLDCGGCSIMVCFVKIHRTLLCKGQMLWHVK